MAYSDIPAGDVYMGGGGQFARHAWDAIRPPEASEYSADLDSPDSFTRGLLALQQHSKAMQVAASAGDMDLARWHYQVQNDFLLANQDKLVRATTMNPRNDMFLRSIWAAATSATSRSFDGVALKTPYGDMTALDAFGPNGQYEKMRDTRLTSASFSKPVADLLSGKAEDVFDEGRTDGGLKSIVEAITKPVMSEAIDQGAPRVANSDQYAALADYVAQAGAGHIRSVGAEAVRACVNSILSSHMSDGTAVSTYKSAMDMLAARKAKAAAASVPFDPSREAYSLMTSINSITKAMVPAADVPGGNLARWTAMLVSSIAAEDPSVDLDDLGVRQSIMELSDVVARGERAGIRLIPLAQGYGAKVKPAIAGYVSARRQGFDAPPDNLLTRLVDTHSTVAKLITPGWSATPETSRADPTKEVNLASGVFRRDSGAEGLNDAAVALYRSMYRGAMKGAVDGKTGYEAVLGALSDESARLDMARELSRSMLLPEAAALGIVDKFVSMMHPDETGQLVPAGLERAIAEYAYESVDVADAASVPLRRAAARWYDTNVGERGQYYDRLLNDAGWDTMLRDPVFGYGDLPQQQCNAIVANLKQQAKQEMSLVAERGQSPMDVMTGRRRQGRFYFISQFRDAAGNAISLEEADKKKDKNGNIPRDLVPVIGESFGSLDKVKQEYKSSAGPMAEMPVFGEGSYSRNPHQFRSMMMYMKQLREAQIKSAAKNVSAAQEDDFWSSAPVVTP